jgi:hypothetical protein
MPLEPDDLIPLLRDVVTAAVQPLVQRKRHRVTRVLRGRIEPDPASDDAALRRFVEGMAALATTLILEGVIEAPEQEQVTREPATNEPGTLPITGGTP